MHKINKNVVLLALALLLISSISIISAETEYYLDVTTDPLDVIIADPAAVSGAGIYPSGIYAIVDAKQTVFSSSYRYEFIGWEAEDQYYVYDEDDDEWVVADLPGNQAARFMDGGYTMVANYQQINTVLTLTIITNPDEVLTIDSTAVSGAGLYPSGTCVIVDAEQTIISGNVRYEFVEWSTTDEWPYPDDDE